MLHRYVDVLTSSLKQKLSLVEKMIILQKNVKEKRENSSEDINSIRPYLQLLIQRTKELQTEVYLK